MEQEKKIEVDATLIWLRDIQYTSQVLRINSWPVLCVPFPLFFSMCIQCYDLPDLLCFMSINEIMKTEN